MIGLIIPPGEIKKLLEKTAEHVAINGSEFEKILIEREQNKSEFAFLRTDHPFRAYYDHKVAQNSKRLLQNAEGEEERKEDGNKGQGVMKQQREEAVKEEEMVAEVVPEQKAFLEGVFMELKEPDPEKYTVEVPEKLGEGDQAMIMHTAQYAAQNGKNFLVALRERQKNNPQFEFLKSASKHNQYFEQMVAAYTHVLEMTQSQLGQLQRFMRSKEEVFSRCRAAYEYHVARQQQARGRKEQEARKVKESNIDWNDFELVETIAFEEDLNKYMPSSELLSRAQQAPVVPRTMEETIITEPKRKREILQQCHACRQNILASEMNKHLKTCLAHKKRTAGQSEAQEGEEVDIRKNLEGLSLRRPDIFGSQDSRIVAEETAKGTETAYDGLGPNASKVKGTMAIIEFEKNKLKRQQGK